MAECKLERVCGVAFKSYQLHRLGPPFARFFAIRGRLSVFLLLGASLHTWPQGRNALRRPEALAFGFPWFVPRESVGSLSAPSGSLGAAIRPHRECSGASS